MSSTEYHRVMEEGLTRITSCGICQERFHTPKILPCHHTFCCACLEGLSSSGEIVCPECISSHQLPTTGVKSFPDDTKIDALLDLEERWLLGIQQARPGDNTGELTSLKAEFHRLRANVNDFNKCKDLWDRIQQSSEDDIAGISNGKQIESAVALLRRRRRLLHQKLDEFLKEETAAIQARAKCEYNRAGEYCSFVESRLQDFENHPDREELSHMSGQCAAISQQTSRLLNSVCEQTAKMPLKIIKATDDIKSHRPPKTFYGVDVAVQAYIIEDDLVRKFERSQNLPPIGYVPPLRSRRSSTDSNSTICSRKSSVVAPYNPRFYGMDHQGSKKIRQYGDIHKMKVFGKSWFQGVKKPSDGGPTGLGVVRDNLVAVTDSVNGCIRLCTSSGLSPRRLLTHDGIFSNFGNPQAVCMDLPQRHMYATDKDNACVVVLDIDTGEDVNTITCAGHRPIGIALDPGSDTLYICCDETHSVVMYRTDGTQVGQIGERGRGPGQFLHPHSLAISPENRLWVTDTNNNRIQVFSLSGKYMKTIGSKGSGQGQLNHPRGLAIDDRGFVLVADTGNQRIQIFDAYGKSVLIFGREGGPVTGGPVIKAQGKGVLSHHNSGPVGVASTGSGATRGKVFVSYQGDSRIVAYLVQYQKMP